MGKAHTAFHNCLCFVSLAAAVLVAISQPANADSKLVLQTKAVLIIVGSSFEACYLTLGEANLLDRTGDLKGARSKLNELSECIENAPNKVQGVVDGLRSTMSRKPKALAALKDYVLAYRELLARLESPSTTVSEASRFSAVLDGKAARVIAETEW